MSVVVHRGRLRQEMARRGWSAADLARESELSEATVCSALAGRAIAPRSLSLIAQALSRVPAIEIIDVLVLGKPENRELE